MCMYLKATSKRSDLVISYYRQMRHCTTLLICLVAALIIFAILFRIRNRTTKLSSILGGASSEKAITPKLKVKITKNTNVKGTLTEEIVRKNIMKLDVEYDKNVALKKNFSRIRNKLHPFSTLRKTIRSKVLGDKEVVITNAFMKCYEFITTFNVHFNSLYDIASAPGMFVICADYVNKGNLRWHACSYVPKEGSDDVASLTDNAYLEDTYGLFKMHPDCFENVNVLNDDDINKVISNEHSSYDLVTGDIGYIHGYNELQEESHKDLQQRQALLAAHLTKEGGNVFLKMYSCITAPSMLLVSNLSKYFRELYLWKPYTSRITNVETYIVGIHRNKLRYESVGDETSSFTHSHSRRCKTSSLKNEQLFYDYYNGLATYKNILVDELLRNFDGGVNVKKWLKDLSKVYDTIEKL